MNTKFWQSEANKFTLYGAIFGMLFPVIATLLQAFLKHGAFDLNSLIDVQGTDPLLWIIDSAPFWLGLFARFAGRRQDNLKEIIRQNDTTGLALPEDVEDSQQFAGLLTFLGIALIGVVLFGFSIWLQRLIMANNTPAVQQQFALDANNNATAGVGDSGLTGIDQIAPTATSAPVVISIQPATVAPTLTAIPSTSTEAPTDIPTLAPEPTPEPPPAEPEVAGPEINNDQANSDQAASDQAASDQASNEQASNEQAAATNEISDNQIVLGVVQRDLDCQFFTELAATAWQGIADVSIETRAYDNAEQLFADLTAAPNINTLFLTFCFVDPDDRPFLRQYISELQIIGKAYWQVDGRKLLTIANAGAPGRLRQNLPEVYNFMVNQNYEDGQITSQNAATWLEQNQATVQQWLEN